jgi:hypothetical protein
MRHSRVDLILVAFVAVTSLKLMAFIGQVADLRLHDETYYLYGGINSIHEGLPEPEWAPLYVLWYYLLSQFTQDNITLHFFNHQVLVLGSAIAFYLYLRTFPVNPFLAAIFSFFLGLSALNQVFPRPTNFALFILLVFLAIALRCKTESSYAVIASLGLLSISFVRPEYFVAFLVFCLVYSFFYGKRILTEGSDRPEYFKISVFCLTTIACLSIFGNPLGGERSWWAFRQHFSVNWVEWTGSDRIPWTDYIEIVKSVFGEAENIGEALQANPQMFFAHIFTNFQNYLLNSINILLVSLEIDGFNPGLTRGIKYLEVVGLVAVLVYVFRKRSRLFQQVDRTLLRRLSIIYCCLFVAILPSVLIVYPRDHYLVIQGAMLLSILAYCLSCTIPQTRQNSAQLSKAIALGLLLFMLTPNLAKGWCLAPNLCFLPKTESVTQPNLAIVEFIKSLNIKDSVNLLEAEGGYHIYLGENYNRVGEYLKYDRFSEFAQKRKINAIVLSRDLIKHHKFVNDEEFKQLMQNPEAFDYVSFEISGTELKVLVKQELL